jgi:EF-P beta-lysylation protein EpmB
MSAESYSFVPGIRTPVTARPKRPPAPEPPPRWQAELRDAVRDPAELAALLDLTVDQIGAIPGETSFPLLVPRGFVARMRKGDPDDPLLRQVLPAAAESVPAAGFGPDPLAEHELARDGCLRKYPGRMLLISTAACPVHCRYCFRREFPYAAQLASRDDWQDALATIKSTAGISEVILSGGDPLTLANAKLSRLIDGLEALPRITTLRIHTRFPVVIPARVDAGLMRLLAATRLHVVVVAHANHAAEIDAKVAEAAAKLKTCTSLLLTQAGLRRGVNDSVAALVDLSERLVACGIAPYYLHLLDRVAGAAHFEVDAAAGSALVAAMRKQVPGYLVPRLVREVAGELSKTPIG